jgi:hypothetical protein
MEYLGPILGGLLIGLAASGLMLFLGRIAGVSGIFSGLLKPTTGDLAWRLAFVLGLVAGGAVLFILTPATFSSTLDRSVITIALGGLLVGFGARLGSGCTSGHGVCGMARIGPRSIIATMTFIASGVLVTYFANHIMGGAV